jgi:hypothetical protein
MTKVIYYPPGCYGTFFEWCCRFFSKDNNDTCFPFNDDGSSHKFYDTEKLSQEYFREEVLEFFESGTQKDYIRCHPGFFEKPNSFETFHSMKIYELYKADLEYLKNHNTQVLILYPVEENKIWIAQNIFLKAQLTEELFEKKYAHRGYNKDFFRPLFVKDVPTKIQNIIEYNDKIQSNTFNSWNKNNINELDLWELREFLSLYWFRRDKYMYNCWPRLKNDYPEFKFISTNDLKMNIKQSILDALDFFNVESHKLEMLDLLVNEWTEKQIHMVKDDLCKKIVDCIEKRISYSWEETQLNILDEAYIQFLLLQKNIKIKCFNLNQFPNSTDKLESLIE